MRAIKEPLCPAFQKVCDQEGCTFWNLFPGDDCPIMLDPDALSAIEEAFKEAAQYLDGIMGLGPGSVGGIAEKVKRQAKEGKINWKQIARDLNKLE